MILVDEDLDLLGMDGLEVKHLLFGPLVSLQSDSIRPDLPLQLQAHLGLSSDLTRTFLALVLDGGYLCLQSLVS